MLVVFRKKPDDYDRSGQYRVIDASGYTREEAILFCSVFGEGDVVAIAENIVEFRHTLSHNSATISDMMKMVLGDLMYKKYDEDAEFVPTELAKKIGKPLFRKITANMTRDYIYSFTPFFAFRIVDLRDWANSDDIGRILMTKDKIR